VYDAVAPAAAAIHVVCAVLRPHRIHRRGLTSALRDLFYELNGQCLRFREVVLTAPDIDADAFRRDLAPALVRTADRVALYASSNDEVLVLWKKPHAHFCSDDRGPVLHTGKVREVGVLCP